MTAVAAPIDLQKIAVKILTDAPPSLDLSPFLSIFARWRMETDHPAQWVDLADYAHMPRGPGIILIGKLSNFSFDLSGAGPGILYATKKGLEGDLTDRLRSVLRSGLELARRLLGEPEFPSGIHVGPGSLELHFNDRLETPNTEATDRLLRPALLAVLGCLYSPAGYELRRQPDPGKVYGFSVRAAGPATLNDLMQRLGA